MAQIIKVDGSVVSIEPKNGKDFSLEELQNIVGGYVEIHKLKNNELMVMDEEGYFKRKHTNSKATWRFCEDVTYAIIVGDVLICNDKQIK